MPVIAGIKFAIYAAIFFAGIGVSSWVLLPRINMWESRFNEQVTLNASLSSSIDEQNAKVHEIGEESDRIKESAEIALEQAKKDNVVREHKVVQLIALKPNSIDLCKDARELIDKELMQ